MKTKTEEDLFYYDMQNAVDGIQRIDEDMEGKRILLTFFDRTDFLRMSQFLKVIKSIMLDFYEETLPLQTKTLT